MTFKRFLSGIIVIVIAAASGAAATARRTPDLSRYEGRVVASVEVVTEEAARDATMEEEYRALLRIAPGRKFSAVLVRESLQNLFGSGRIANTRVEAFDAVEPPGADGQRRIVLRFVVRPQVLIGEVTLDLGVAPGSISEDELRARLNLLEPGKRVSVQALRSNADLIQTYLRDRGFYRANVEYEQQLDTTKTRASIIYRITPGEPSLLEAFNVDIKGFDAQAIRPDLGLRPGEPFTQSALGEDINRIRQSIIKGGNLAPRLGEPQIQLNSTTNRITVSLAGAIGPKVNVEISGGYEVSDEKQRELLPVRREGSLDQSAIVEGARRLRNELQGDGYFFADVTATCTVAPPLPPSSSSSSLSPGETRPPNGQIFEPSESCAELNADELSGRTVTINYEAAPGRRFKLSDIRIEGTEKLTVADVADDLRTTEANALGLIPFFGFGRGFTSDEALESDARTIRARMRDLGYRQAGVEVRRGVSLEGENLIITFVIAENALTRVASIEVRGNQIFTTETLRDAACPAERLPDELCTVRDGPFSISVARSESERLRNFYARNGYLDSNVELDVVNLPRRGADEQVRLIYTVTEAEKVFINRIFVNGNIQTKRDAVIKAIPLREGEVLRADNIAESERRLYATDNFRQVIIRTEAAGETASGFKRRDVIIDVEERKRLVVDYGGGYSTDSGPLGLFEIRNNNLFGEMRQGAIRTRASRRQQLVRFEYFDPRFRGYGENRFAPLVLSLQYQRDSSVTRFFRSTIDRGNFGIVQRLDENGQPIDLNCVTLECETVSSPTINRFSFTAETQRDLELELGPQGQVRKRSTLFLRYNYEDVRLYNLNSLLLADILRPDRAVRLSRFGVTFARDTRDSQFDPTRGDFLTADYAISLKALGGNLSFSKFLTTYRRYYKINRIRPTVFAASVQLGLASIYQPEDRDDNGVIDDFDRTLPISERFFSGGSTTLRGFSFEEAGPRQAVVPPAGVVFRDNNGDPVNLNPFLVPIGGNALGVVNLEARIGVAKNIQVVPFYDGGNVFRRVGDIFGREAQPGEDPNLRARWTHTTGIGLRFTTPFGPLSIDYGYLLNPQEFMLPQGTPANPQDPAIIRLRRGQLHFRFGQTF